MEAIVATSVLHSVLITHVLLLMDHVSVLTDIMVNAVKTRV